MHTARNDRELCTEAAEGIVVKVGVEPDVHPLLGAVHSISRVERAAVEELYA